MNIKNAGTALALDEITARQDPPRDPLATLVAARPLNLNSPTPLYAQLVSLLADYIALLGAQGVGQPLPSENECIQMFGVSRPTVRQAINELMARGLVRKERGRGTFISEPRLVHDITHIFEDDMRAARRQVEFHLLEHGDVPIPPELRETFGRHIKHLYRILRQRSVAGRVIGIEQRFLPVEFKRFLTPKALAEQNLFSFLRLCTQADRFTSVNTVRAVELEAHDAARLDVPKGSAALVRETAYYTDQETSTPVMYGIVTFLAGQYQLQFRSSIELRTSPEDGHHG